MNMTKRWPHIARFLNVDDSGRVDYDFLSFSCAEEKLSPAERAAANEEWADYFEYRLAQRADELAGNHVKRHLVEVWTDSMVYLSRRCAALARGEDPGPWIGQHVRRPDLDRTELEAVEDHLVGAGR
jgi:hypothetical protein